MTQVEYSVSERFGLNLDAGHDMVVTGNDHPCQFTPPIDHGYKHRIDLIRDMFGFWVSGEIAMLQIGHSGCGKTSMIEQWHARLNLPLLTVVAHPRMEIADLIGHFIPTGDGGMAFHYGPVTRAALEGWSVLIDEYFVLDPGVATGLNAFLQGGMLYIPETGESIRAKEGFRIFAATNPADVGAGYFGRNNQDAANLDRFYVVQVPYPEAIDETPLIQQVLLDEGIGDDSVALLYAERMVSVANSVRKVYCGESDTSENGNSSLEAGSIDITMSTRTLKRWAKLFMLFNSMPEAEIYSLNRALLNRASPESAQAIKNLVQVEFGTKAD